MASRIVFIVFCATLPADIFVSGSVISGPGVTAIETELITSCPSWDIDANLNVTWLESVPSWFFTISSGSYLHPLLRLTLGKQTFNSLTQDELSQFCITGGSFGDKEFSFRGIFEGKDVKQRYFLHPFIPGVIEWSYKGRYVGRSHIVLTDNSSFVLLISRFQDGRTGFHILTTKNILLPSSYSKIVSKIEKLGFEAEPLYFANCQRVTLVEEGSEPL